MDSIEYHWIKPVCGTCGEGNYAQLRPTTLLHCANEHCDHVISVGDFVDVEEWRIDAEGLVEVLTYA
ncbi:hypothetical protein [Streptomyces sp. NPDC048603]|uniref:hypothetical protein n=1 Tax=Streptomyces sp. NPDC048603 TaxID=3365577 RepID=UPI00371AA208